MKELISCIIPTYNRIDYLKEAIESVINQTYDNWELLVVDDQSTDCTKQVVQEYIKGDKRIKYFCTIQKGGNHARNLGIINAQGNLIAFLDDDDICLPDRFQKQYFAFQNSNSGFIVSGMIRFDNDTGKTTPFSNKSSETAVGFPSRWLIRKDILIKAGLFDTSFPGMQDVEFSYRIAKYTTYDLQESIVVRMRVAFGSVSRSDRVVRGLEKMIVEKSDYIPEKEKEVWIFRLFITFFIRKNRKGLKNSKRFLKDIKSRKIRFYVRLLLILQYLNFRILRILIRRISSKLVQMPSLVNHKVIPDN